MIEIQLSKEIRLVIQPNGRMEFCDNVFLHQENPVFDLSGFEAENLIKALKQMPDKYGNLTRAEQEKVKVTI